MRAGLRVLGADPMLAAMIPHLTLGRMLIGPYLVITLSVIFFFCPAQEQHRSLFVLSGQRRNLHRALPDLVCILIRWRQ